jgi:hypothetical protein
MQLTQKFSILLSGELLYIFSPEKGGIKKPYLDISGISATLLRSEFGKRISLGPVLQSLKKQGTPQMSASMGELGSPSNMDGNKNR